MENRITHNILPNISVDCVIFGFDFQKLNVLLVERKLCDENDKLIVDDLTLAGYHIYEDEDLDSAAARILENVTGLKGIYLEQFGAFGDLNRVTSHKDQLWINHINKGFKQRVVTIGYFSLIDNTKVTLAANDKNVKWYPINEVDKLDFAYDHGQILDKALKTLQLKIEIEPLSFELLPEKFTLSQLQTLHECVLNIKTDKRNFRKKIAQMPYVIPLKKKQKGVSHKPAQMFMFSREVYDKLKV